MNYFIQEGGVPFGSQIFANEDCDRTVSDLKLEGGGPWRPSSSLTDGVFTYFASLEITMAAFVGISETSFRPL